MTTDYTKEIGERIREVRRQLHITQRKFAGTLSLSPGNLSSIETGRCNATSALIHRIAINYDVSLNYLFLGIGSMFLSEETDTAKAVKNRESVDRLETTEDLSWLIEHSSMFRNTIMGYAATYFYQNQENIKRNVEQLKAEKENKDGDKH